MTLLAGFVSSCSVSRFVPDDKQLIHNYQIKIQDKREEVETSELRALIKPKPNARFLIWKPKLYNYYKSKKKPTKLNLWLNKQYGEEPVYTEEISLNKTNRDLKIYLSNIGFFNSKVNYEILSEGYKDRITFLVNLGIPYTISKFDYNIQDSLINQFVLENVNNSLIKEGDIYNAYTMDDERDRITDILRNSGYYLFSRNYIQFVVDSNHRNHTMDVTLKLSNRKISTKIPGKFTEQKHDRYFINSVTIARVSL